MACILRDNNGEIETVQDNQGNNSKLYSEALSITNSPNQAADIWAVAYSEQYQNINGEFQQEPSLKDVMTFMQRNNNQNKSLTKDDIDELTNNTLSLPFSFTEEIYGQSRELYPNGIFTISERTLNASKLYSPAEVQYILNDQEAQNKIKTFFDKLQGQVALNNTQDTTLALYESPEFVEVQNTESLIGVGKFENLNPFIIDAEIRSKVGGIKNRESFETALYNSGINEAIIDRYFSDPIYARKFYESYSSMERMQVLEDSVNGEISTPDYIRNITEQSLIVGQDATNLKNILDLLVSTPRAVWTESSIEVEDMLLRAEDLASDLGIDVIGLSDASYSYEEIIPFLNSLLNVAQKAENGTVQEQDLDSFYDNYNAIFKTPLQLFTAQKVSPKNVGRNLVSLNSIKSEQELFNTFSLVKTTEDGGVYQRVNRQEDLETLYDYVVDLVQFNPNTIDKKALYPSAYNTDGIFSYAKAKDLNNRDGLKEDLRRYVQQQPFTEDLTLYKIAFQHPITFSAPSLNINSEFEKVQNLKSNYSYLTQDFISDFGKIYLQEKLKDSTLFNKLLNHFTFNNSGIALKNNDPYSKQQINLFTPETGTLSYLRDYANISKDSALNSIYTTQTNIDNIQPTQSFIREFYLNNTEQLPKKALQYELSENKDNLAVQNLQDNFINVENNIFEKVSSYKNISIYQRLPNVNNPYFKNYNTNINPDTNVNVEQFSELIQALETLERVEKLYTNKELEQINSEKQC